MLPPFGWQAALTRWEFAPAVTAAVAAAAVLYLWGAWRVRRDHPARPWPAWRTGMFLCGLAVIVTALQSGIASYDDVLYWDHMIQHLLLLMVAPPLLVLGQPFTLALHASRNPVHNWVKRALRSRVAGALTWPPFALALYVITVFSTHLTGLAELTITSQAAHHAEHALYLASGYLFYLPLVGREPLRWRLSYPIRLLVLVVTMPVDTFTGLMLMYQPTGFPSDGPRPPGSPSPLTDAHWAGAVMWIGGDAIMFAFMMLVVLLWSVDERAAGFGHGWLEAARKASFDRLVGAAATAGEPATPGQDHAGGTVGGDLREAGRLQNAGRLRDTGIDDDEHLAAYNAYLARLHRGGS